jgi:hypothetical protein
MLDRSPLPAFSVIQYFINEHYQLLMIQIKVFVQPSDPTETLEKKNSLNTL